MLTIVRATPEVFDAIGTVIESSYGPHDASRTMPNRHPSEPGGVPFTWWGDPTLSWWLASLGDSPAAFALWRHEGRNAHLHSFFVAAEAQRCGVGSELMHFHVAQAARENERLASLTLHVQAEAVWARAFYARHGYIERDPRSIPIAEDSGLGDWVRTYERHGWPGGGKQLLVRSVASSRG